MTRARTPREVLIAARWIIANVGWTQGANATDVHGRGVPIDSKLAARFCSLGAIDVTEVEYSIVSKEKTKDLLRQFLLPYSDIVSFNDTPGRTKAEVLAVFDLAIARAR